MLSLPKLATERGDTFMYYTFLVSVIASVVAYFVCKWLDRNNGGN